MEKIVVALGTHRNEIPAAKTALEVVTGLRKLGFSVTVEKRKQNNLLNITKLKRVVALFKLSDRIKAGKCEEGRSLLPERFLTRVSEASGQFQKRELQWKTVEGMYASLQNLVQPMKSRRTSLSEARLANARHIEKLIQEEVAGLGGWYWETNEMNWIHTFQDAEHREYLARKYPGHHVFDMHNFACYRRGLSFDEQVRKYYHPEIVTPERVQKLEQDFTANFKPEAIGHTDDVSVKLKEGIVFLHHLRRPDGKVPVSFEDEKRVKQRGSRFHLVTIELPSKTRFTRKWNAPTRYETDYLGEIADLHATEKAGLLKGVSEAVVEEIRRMVTRRA